MCLFLVNIVLLEVSKQNSRKRAGLVDVPALAIRHLKFSTKVQKRYFVQHLHVSQYIGKPLLQAAFRRYKNCL